MLILGSDIIGNEFKSIGMAIENGSSFSEASAVATVACDYHGTNNKVIMLYGRIRNMKDPRTLSLSLCLSVCVSVPLPFV